ncbi:hypothetical protein ACCT16_37310, partial [Rhizobium ruizarguesonis]
SAETLFVVLLMFAPFSQKLVIVSSFHGAEGQAGDDVTLILTWVFAWNEYLLAATLNNFHARTLTTGLSEYVTTTGTAWGI